MSALAVPKRCQCRGCKHSRRVAGGRQRHSSAVGAFLASHWPWRLLRAHLTAVCLSVGDGKRRTARKERERGIVVERESQAREGKRENGALRRCLSLLCTANRCAGRIPAAGRCRMRRAPPRTAPRPQRPPPPQSTAARAGCDQARPLPLSPLPLLQRGAAVTPCAWPWLRAAPVAALRER